MDVLGKRWNCAYGKNRLTAGFAKRSSSRGVEEHTPRFRADGRGSAAALGRTSGRGLLSVHGGLRTLFERLEVPDHAFASVVRELEILGKFERISRASIFAQAAEHATAQVVRKL